MLGPSKPPALYSSSPCSERRRDGVLHGVLGESLYVNPPPAPSRNPCSHRNDIGSFPPTIRRRQGLQDSRIPAANSPARQGVAAARRHRHPRPAAAAAAAPALRRGCGRAAALPPLSRGRGGLRSGRKRIREARRRPWRRGAPARPPARRRTVAAGRRAAKRRRRRRRPRRAPRQSGVGASARSSALVLGRPASRVALNLESVGAAQQQ